MGALMRDSRPPSSAAATPQAPAARERADDAHDARDVVIIDELVVEDVSIDGMCGVY
ncbi:MAG: mycofactocin precursor MftA [Solirubrobacteraceae bacterium]